MALAMLDLWAPNTAQPRSSVKGANTMAKSMNTSKVETGSKGTYVCPACTRKFELELAGGLYALHHREFDDAFITVLCRQCTHICTAEPNDPDRLALKHHLQEYFHERHNHPLHGAIAMTTLKILEVHYGDIVKAIEIGWPFPKAMHHYHVVTLPGAGMVMVTEKEGDHDS